MQDVFTNFPAVRNAFIFPCDCHSLAARTSALLFLSFQIMLSDTIDVNLYNIPIKKYEDRANVIDPIDTNERAQFFSKIIEFLRFPLSAFKLID